MGLRNDRSTDSIKHAMYLSESVPTEWGWEFNGTPFGCTYVLGGLIESTSQIEDMNAFGRHNQWIDFQVGEVQVHVDLK